MAHGDSERFSLGERFEMEVMWSRGNILETPSFGIGLMALAWAETSQDGRE
jgi:hypothetical protein